MRYQLVCCFFAMLITSAAMATPEELFLYVAPNGNDAWSGRIEEPNSARDDGPLATISGARDAVRAVRARNPSFEDLWITVLLRGGTYAVREEIVFTPEDSEVIYAAFPGERPVLDGGLRITEWQVENGRWKAQIPKALLEEYAVGAFWINGERRDAARYPKASHPAGDYPAGTDFLYTDGPVMDAHPQTGESVKSNTRIRYAPNDLPDWKHLDDAVFVVFHSWETSLHRLKSIDRAERILTFTGPAPWHFTYWKNEQWYFIDHLLDVLERPGEWCLDRREGVLHYLPRPGETPETVEAVIPLARRFLVLQGRPEEGAFVRDLHFKGIVFQYADRPIGAEGHSDAQAAFGVGAVIEATGAQGCLWEDCTIAHIGGYAIWLRAGSRDNRIQRCAIYDLGAGAVRIGEAGDPPTDAHAVLRNTVDNCLLHDGGRIFRGAVGVWIGRSSHNTVTHNEICDFRYTGVSVGWSWGYDPSSANHNIIAYNHIHNLGKGQLSDMGGIYTLGLSPGTELRNNHIHDILSNPNISGGWGLYTDEGSTDILLTDNVVWNTMTGGFHQHYGRDNRVVNNIFAFSHREQIIRSREEEHLSFSFERNLVYFNNGQLLGGNWGNGNFFLDHNGYWDASGKNLDFKGSSWKQWRTEGNDTHSAIVNPGFADPERGDFRLPDDSPVLALGFKPIDVSKAGLYGDASWVARADAVRRTPVPESFRPGAARAGR